MALKLLKFALVAVAVLSLFDGTEQACRGKPVPDRYTDIKGCTEPQEALVQLQVPKGFAYVEPSFVRVKQCTGLSCGHNRHCVPQEDDIALHKFKVKAYKENEKVCKEIEVEEHGECQCQCQDPGCRKNMVVKEETCECVCDPVEKENCDEQTRLKGNVMWSTRSCSCECNVNHRSHCGTGEEFDEEECECVGVEDNSEENYV